MFQFGNTNSPLTLRVVIHIHDSSICMWVLWPLHVARGKGKKKKMHIHIEKFTFPSSSKETASERITEKKSKLSFVIPTVRKMHNPTGLFPITKSRAA